MRKLAPGQAIGILGSGQLGRMFTVAAKQMGYRVHVYSPQVGSPAGQVADVEFVGDYAAAETVADFARSIAVATIEFENIPVPTIDQVANFVPVRPGSDVLSKIQNRISEKTFLQSIGVPVARFKVIRTQADAAQVPPDLFPAVLKTAATGYDGKGQQLVHTPDELLDAWLASGKVESVIETLVEYDCEFSVIAARGVDGQTVCYEPILNQHANHILDVSISPASLPAAACERATGIARSIAEALDYVGVLCVEFFLLPAGEVLVNEIAPRPHNSGHLTIEAHATSQFEQQVRAVCGLPLGSTKQIRAAAMANILGGGVQDAKSGENVAQRDPSVSLHLYGKKEVRQGRKMGHLTCVADSTEAAVQRVLKARESLRLSDLGLAACR